MEEEEDGSLESEAAAAVEADGSTLARGVAPTAEEGVMGG